MCGYPVVGPTIFSGDSKLAITGINATIKPERLMNPSTGSLPASQKVLSFIAILGSLQHGVPAYRTISALTPAITAHIGCLFSASSVLPCSARRLWYPGRPSGEFTLIIKRELTRSRKGPASNSQATVTARDK
jgi:hypothetical protein